MITAMCQKIQMVRFVKKSIHRHVKQVNSSVKMGVHLSEDNKIKETRDKGLIVRVMKIELNDLRHCFIFPSLDYY